MNRTLASLLLALSACYSTPSATPPKTFTAAETPPPRPDDPSQPLPAIVWTLHYDLRQFDDALQWLTTQVPDGPERDRALAVASLIGVAELDRYELLDDGVARFDKAIAAFPDDARLSCWRAYLVYLKARRTPDDDGLAASLGGLRTAAQRYPAFTEFGVTLAIGGLEYATDAELAHAAAAFDNVFTDTDRLELSSAPADTSHLRRIWDTPVAPFNIPAMQAMIGDLALRRGDTTTATRSYYTALHVNSAFRWPWRAEVQRRLQNLDSVASGLTTHPATESSLGSQGLGAMGITAPVSDPRFGGRIGNGSCTVCHTHVSSFDLNEPADTVGWVKARMAPIVGVANAMPTAFLIPQGANAIPGGFGIGPYVDVDAPGGFDTDDARYDGTFIVPAPAGTYFLALKGQAGDATYQGYASRELGLQWFFTLEAGQLLDLSATPIPMSPALPQQ